MNIILKKQEKNNFHGFTVVEFISIIVIFGLVASVAIFGYSQFQSNIALRNLAYEIALSIRQAQSYGITSSGDITSNISVPEIINNLDQEYVGVRIDSSSDRIIIFSGQLYSSAAELESYGVSSAAEISEICAGTESACLSRNSIDIIFRRASTAAMIGSVSASLPYARITVAGSSLDSTPHAVSVFSSGVISVEEVNP